MGLPAGQGSLLMFSCKYIPCYNFDPHQLTLSQTMQAKIQDMAYRREFPTDTVWV